MLIYTYMYAYLHLNLNLFSWKVETGPGIRISDPDVGTGVVDRLGRTFTENSLP